MHVHILGICGTFMGGIALLAKQLGFEITGSDENVYPPMSSQLQSQGISLMSGYSARNLDPKPDLVVIGNALSRGNDEVEAILNRQIPFISGPQWLGENLLKNRWVMAVAGTHGKTTCSAMLAWILEEAGHFPGFLIGGIPINFGQSARMGRSRFFVVEADEYDTAFFDKRSKFVHYHPRTVILNNLEFDHADIFSDLNAIQTQFHHLVRTIPGTGLIVRPASDINLDNVIQRGCWTPVQSTSVVKAPEDINHDWTAILTRPDGESFEVYFNEKLLGNVDWNLTGTHNVNNALSAVAAAHHAGVEPMVSLRALSTFKNVKRRMEVRGVVNGITIYDDFAHHPTAIRTTLDGLRAHVGKERIIAVLEPRSNTMRLGIHADKIPDAVQNADIAIIYQAPGVNWPIKKVFNDSDKIRVINSIDGILDTLKREAVKGDHLVFMSNGGFSGIYEKTEELLSRV